jgi:hypothetical protein
MEAWDDISSFPTSLAPSKNANFKHNNIGNNCIGGHFISRANTSEQQADDGTNCRLQSASS